ncbi:hypothetical protein DRQ00_02370 [candidate division KSB1 bacterium]|nr:MAG: hypothetical protein B5M50_02660 [candidate division KSB1 bacterium 4484_219]RKY78783.1 MAG: hypothetical protein DRQ12_05250 [candidate division KSB1 bacterium]RKY80185.1 MAG: hypothetical protein DRQ00_02370 [candidate division KSB1 bacterium]RKY89298.1 MAG: hypothetical protein DRQ11_01370 [candidate division KSB1 bacterium]
MNPLDIAILVVLAVFMLRGILNGFIRQILGLVGLIISLVLAIRWMSNVAAVIVHYTGFSAQIATAVGFVGLFLLLYLGCIGLARLLRKIMQLAMLGWLDRLGGGTLGLVKGGILVSVLVLVMTIIPFGVSVRKLEHESLLFRPMQRVAPSVFNLVRKWMPSSGDFYQELKESLYDQTGKLTPDVLEMLQFRQSDNSEKKESKIER